MTKSTKITFSSDLSYLQAVRGFVRHVCESARGDRESLVSQLQLAVNEIFCNIVKHSYHNRLDGKIVIESQILDDGIAFTVSDQGDVFNPAEASYPDLSGTQEHGFGLYIIQQVADKVVYTPKTAKDEWNHLHLFKRYIILED